MAFFHLVFCLKITTLILTIVRYNRIILFYNNFNTLDKIIKFTKLDKPEVESVFKELENQRLVSKFEKKVFLWQKNSV